MGTFCVMRFVMFLPHHTSSNVVWRCMLWHVCTIMAIKLFEFLIMFWSRWRWKRSRHPRRMRNPQFWVPGKRPMTRKCHRCFNDMCKTVIWVNAFLELSSPNSVYITVVFIKKIPCFSKPKITSHEIVHHDGMCKFNTIEAEWRICASVNS